MASIYIFYTMKEMFPPNLQWKKKKKKIKIDVSITKFLLRKQALEMNVNSKIYEDYQPDSLISITFLI